MNSAQPQPVPYPEKVIASWPARIAFAFLLLLLFLSAKPSNAQQEPKGQRAAPVIPAKVNRAAQSATVDAQAMIPGEDETDEGDAVLQRMEWFYKQRSFPLPHIPAGARLKAFEQMQIMMETEGKLFRTPQGGVAATPGGPAPVPVWQPIGPAPATGGFFSPVTGRITTIAVDPRDPSGDSVLIGGAQGGIWRSTTAGNSWAPETDFAPSLAMGSIAFASSSPNIVYAGTGEQASTGFDVYYGAGVLKSTDGGLTWNVPCPTPGPSCNNPFVGPFGSDFFPGGGARISYLSVNPSNPNLILAGVQIFTGTDAAGVYCSDDGGLNWANILPGQMATFAGYASSTVAFAALGRTSGSFPGTTNPNGIYKSTIADGKGSGGNLPAKCTNITFTNLTASIGLTGPVGRVDMGIFDANTVYASVADANTNSRTNQGIWVTTNGGANWTRTNAPDICRNQCWYDNVVKADPFDPSGRTVFFGGGAVIQNNAFSWVVRSTDGTNFTPVIPTSNFSDPSRPHVDQHAMAFVKLPNGQVRLYLGNDGGIWRTDDAEASTIAWTNINNPPLQLAQFYPSLSVHPSNPSFAFAGTQDNGSLIYSGSANWIDNNSCGDGGWTLIDPVTPSTVYILCQFLSLQKSTTNGTPNSFSFADNGIDPSDQLNFIAPMAIDPANPNRLYFGTNRIWQTVDGANSWQPTSSVAVSPGAVIVALAVGGSAGSVLYGATSDARVFAAQNVGPGSIAPYFTFSLPPRVATQIVIDLSDPSGKTAYITYSGFSGFGDGMGHIFKTVNAGASSWADVSSNLPNVPVNDLVIDPDLPGTLYAATDIGVFLSSNGGATWATFNNNSLPNVAVLSLRMHRASRTLFATTHGRGAWNLSLGGTSTFGITLISPTSAQAGAPDTSFTVGGNGFTPNSRIAFAINGNTTIITPGVSTANQLTAVIPAAAIASSGNAQVTVTDGVQRTNALTFTVLAPAPTISGVIPNRISVNSPDTTITVTGTNFNSKSKVILNPAFSGSGGNVTLATTFSSSSQLSAIVPASLMAQFGSTNDVGVVTPPPGGGVTTFPPLLPTLTVVSPPPINDNFANALNITLVSNSFTDTRDSSAATTEPTDPRPPCAVPVPGNPAPGTANTIWYKLTGVRGSVTIDTIGSSYDTVLSVWTGSAGALSPVPNACNDDINPGIIITSRVNFSATSGTTYFILVSSFGAGDPNPVAFGGKSVINVSVVTPPFTLASQPATNTVNAGASATYTISATAQSGFASPINLTCTVQPPAGVVPPAPPTCTFSNASITPGGSPSTSTLTVATTSRAIFLPLHPEPRWPTVPSLWLIALVVPLAAWIYLARTKRQRSLAGATLAALVLLLIFGAAGCGGGGSTPPAAHGTTAGQYTITLTGTSGSMSDSIPVTLNVN